MYDQDQVVYNFEKIYFCLFFVDEEKSSRTTSECSVIDEKLSSSIVKLAGRNEIPETF